MPNSTSLNLRLDRTVSVLAQKNGRRIAILLALVAIVGQAQPTDTIAIGMELRIQDFIGTRKFM